MPAHFADLFPPLSALADGTLLVLALAAVLHAVVLTGPFVPLSAIVIVAGMLAQRGVIDPATVIWAVVMGTFAGSAISRWVGWLGRGADLSGARLAAAAALWRGRGGVALILGRLRGADYAFVPFAAGLQDAAPWRFLAWNAAAALTATLILTGIGYGAGFGLSTLGAAAPRVLVFAAIMIAGLFVPLWIWWRGRRRWPEVRPIIAAVIAALTHTRWVGSLSRRHPRLTRFFAARFGTDQFLGLTATVLGVLMVYVVGAYFESVTDFLGTQGQATSDTRIANLFYAMRDDRLIAALGWITTFGGRHGVLPLLAGTTLALLILRRFDLLGGLWLAAAGNQITVTLLKSFFARPRSDLGYFVETSGSFPSGHAAGAVAVWAMLFYLAWRLRVLPAGIAAYLAVTVAMLIGLSRIYLVEHYASDVLNGYLVGGLWLILGIAFCEWRRRGHRPGVTGARRAVAASCVTVAVAAAFVIATTTVSELNAPVTRTTRVVADWTDVLQDPGLSPETTALSGTPRQSINLIVTAPDAATLSATLTAAGWQTAPRPGLSQLAQALVSAWTNGPLPQPLVVPTFWDARPSALDFARPDAATPDDRRLHLRFWDSLRRTPAGQSVYVGTLTSEEPLDWVLTDTPVPISDTGIADALDTLRGGLTAAGLATATP